MKNETSPIKIGSEMPGRNSNSAEQFIGRYLSRILHNNPYFLPYLQEFQGFDKESFKHVVSVAEIAELAFTEYALEVHLPQEELLKGIEHLSIGGIFHDFGKSAIDKNGLRESYNALHPERGRRLIEGAIADVRTGPERAIMHSHPLVGKGLLEDLFNTFPTSKQLSIDVSKLSLQHHQKPPDLAKTRDSYPGILSLNDSPINILFHTFLTLSDIAVSMREPRINRNKQSLPFELISQELTIELPDSLLISIFGKRQNLDYIRKKMVEYIMNPIFTNDTALTQKHYDIEGIPINGFMWHAIAPEDGDSISTLSKGVWRKNEKPIVDSIDATLKIPWIRKKQV